MAEFPETSESLIVRVRDPSNRAAWDQFEQIYRPVIFRIARARGMQHSDAQDLVQQVLLSVASGIHNYERYNDGTRFRNWLNRITRNAILKRLSRGPSDRAAGGSEFFNLMSELPTTDSETDALIELEYRREVYQRAAARVRREVQEPTWLAFELTVLQEQSIEQACRALGLASGSVYAARSRIIRRLRDAVRELEDLTGVETRPLKMKLPGDSEQGNSEK